ncbi:MAG: hypothetical protein HWE22_09765 [Flavobacteriales bacterium]|nr:hypothetical protein [Flavobacteriales bacterium]
MITIDDELIEKVESTDSNTNDTFKNPFVNESSIFFKGLFGMILCMTPGSIIGLVLVNISLNQSREAISIVGKNSTEYAQKEFRRIRQGRTMAFIGLWFFIFEIAALVVLMGVI